MYSLSCAGDWQRLHIAMSVPAPSACGLGERVRSFFLYLAASATAVHSQSERSCPMVQVAQQVHQANELQKNQRVVVRREHVIEIKFHDEEDN